jgi:hypothetical protein
MIEMLDSPAYFCSDEGIQFQVPAVTYDSDHTCGDRFPIVLAEEKL